ncbi:MAG: hypothetical protein FWG22_06635 [Prolixibacteraceae bacterium]|nr:hypothetical protein [Prolixibacteraceae bacterium]
MIDNAEEAVSVCERLLRFLGGAHYKRLSAGTSASLARNDLGSKIFPRLCKKAHEVAVRLFHRPNDDFPFFVVNYFSIFVRSAAGRSVFHALILISASWH